MNTSLKDKFGPCGLLCEKCFAFEKGPIKQHAEKLKWHLGEFDNYANRFVGLLNEPTFGNYKDFKALLALFSAGSCKGCRKQDCHLFSACKVKDCYKEKNVDFCFQCNEYPCNKTGFDENLQQRWIKLNTEIRSIGLETYYKKIKNKPRY